MIKGLYAAFNGMSSAWRYQQVLSNNIANSNTVGYKREVATNETFEDVLLQQQAGVPAPFSAQVSSTVGRIGTGNFLTGFETDFSNGNFQRTDQELDLALEDGFFAVQGDDGVPYYTRAGRFQRDGTGDLLTTTGLRVLDVNGQPVQVGAGPVRISMDGVITSPDGVEVGQIGVTGFAPGDLERAGEAFFRATNPGTPILGGVRQGVLEQSNADMTMDLTSLLQVQRSYQANQTILARINESLDLATGQLGTWR